MSAYRQDYSFRESGFGNITISVIVSDVYSQLFEETNNITNIFLLDEISQELKVSGGLAEDELTFEVTEPSVNTFQDIAALDLVKSARVTSNTVFIAVFVNTSNIPSINDVIFSGVIAAEEEGEDLRWYGDYYETDQTPLRKWRLRARPYSNAVMDKIPFEDLIKAVSSDWITDNVAARPGYFSTDVDGTTISIVHPDLVSLNALLREIADIQTAKLLTDYGITLDIVFDKTTLNGKFLPTRWNHYVKSPVKPPLIEVTGSLSLTAYKTYIADAQTLAIEPDAESETSEDIYIDWKLFQKKDPEIEPNPDNAETFRESIFEKIKSFTQFIYAIAENFGLSLSMTYDNPETLRIRFISRVDFVKSMAYIRGVDGAKLKGETSIDGIELRHYKGKANYYCKEGADHYFKHNRTQYESRPEKDYRSETRGNVSSSKDENSLIFTISPTVVIVKNLQFQNKIFYLSGLPHNSMVYLDGSPAPEYFYYQNWYYQNTGLHSAIYMKVSKNPAHPNSIDEPSEYFTPVAKVILNRKSPLDRINQEFNRIGDYLNGLNSMDVQSFSITYEIETPFFQSFSNNPNGFPLSWKYIEIGSKIVIDGIEYLVEKIKRSLSEPRTALTLIGTAKYDFDSFDGTLTDIPEVPLTAIYTPPEIKEGIAAETISPYDYVSIKDDGTLEISNEDNTHIARLFGMALTGGNEGDLIYVQTYGRVTNSDWNFTPGQNVFLNKFAVASGNMSKDPLLNKSGTRDLYAILGTAENETAIMLFQQPECYLFD